MLYPKKKKKAFSIQKKKTIFLYGYVRDRYPTTSVCSHIEYVPIISYSLTGVLRYSCFLVEEFQY